MRQTEFRLKLDIRRYFASIDHAVLRQLLFRRLRPSDAATGRLIDSILASGREVYANPLAASALGDAQPGCGLPLGSFFSQWSGTFYLDGLDHFIKRELRCRCYLRYMDDFVLFGDDPKWLTNCRHAIADWLSHHRRLLLNSRHLQVAANRQPAVFLGYRIARSGLGPSRKLRRRMRGRLRLAAEKGDQALCRCLQSYKGLLLY